MASVVDTTTALLVELLDLPGYGLGLIERARARSGGLVHLRQGAVYPALGGLLRRKLVRSWNVTTPGSGRSRTYYELTPRGIVLAQAHRDAILGFVAKKARPHRTHEELERMRQRLLECGEVTEAALWLWRAGRTLRRRGREAASRGGKRKKG